MFSFVKIFVCLIVVGMTILQAADAKRIKPCANKKCSGGENVVWASDGNTCFVYRNSCEYKKAICQGVSGLRKVSQADCQELCTDICPEVYDPVCASYNGESLIFGNSCKLASYVCNSGETFQIVSKSKCGIFGTTA